MTRFLAGRVFRLVLVFFIVTFFTMLLIDLTPGDPAISIAGETATPEVIKAVNQQYGFQRPVLERYGDWLGKLVDGDLGRSYQTRLPVMDVIRQRLPVTIQLALMSTFMALLLVVPLGLYTAYRPGSIVDRAVTAISSAFISIPAFVLALLLITLLGITFQVLPVSGWVPLTENLGQNLEHAFLPCLVLAIGETVILLPVLRADVMSTLQQEYITLARSKGISPSRILFRHALRPSSISLVTLAGLSLARLFAGTVIVESIFALPGLGGLLIGSINGKDLIMVQGIVMFIALVYLVTNLVVDLIYVKLDPRVSAR